MKFARMGAVVCCALLVTGRALAEGADGGALIDALVKKGVLSSQEGEDIRSEMMNDYAGTPGGFLSVGSGAVKGLKLYGDARLRYQYDQAAKQSNGQVQERNRYRYRLRIGAEYQFTDSFSSGLRLATGQKRNSTNADFGTVNASFNGDDTIYVDLAYLKTTRLFGLDQVALTAGRQLLGQNLAGGWTWDSDINPDGVLLELGKWNVARNFQIGSTHGMYVWLDGTDNNYAATSDNKSDSFLFINQVDFTWKPNQAWGLRVSPGFVSSMGDDPGATALNTVRDLNVFFIDASLDLPFFVEGWKNNLYGEYGVNLTADDLAERLGYDEGGNQFFLLGYQVSAGKGKGSWKFDLNYAYYEDYSWSGALADSDWNGGYLNGHGLGVKVTYGVTDNVTASLNWRKSWRIDPDAPTALSGDVAASDLIQVDLSWKF